MACDGLVAALTAAGLFEAADSNAAKCLRSNYRTCSFWVRGQNFEDLAASPDFRMPPFGGANGMILELIKAGVMPANLAGECRSLYGRPSKATHSHIDIFTPNMSDTGLSKDWAELTPRVGSVVLELILRLLMKGI
jgi:hypothetical protein